MEDSTTDELGGIVIDQEYVLDAVVNDELSKLQVNIYLWLCSFISKIAQAFFTCGF